MATEHVFADSPAPEVPPIVVETAAEEIKPTKDEPKKEKPAPASRAAKAEDDDDAPARGSSSAGLSKTMKDLREDEDRTLKDIIQAFGDSTAYKCRITRKWPTTTKDRKTGKVHQTGGFLDWIEGTPIDEAWVQDRYGGGKYELLFRKRGPKGGWEHGGQVTIDVAGEPDLKALPGNEPDPAAVVSSRGGGDDTATNAALTMMQAELARANDRADKAGNTGGGPLVDLLREQLAASNAAAAALREEIRNIANKPPVQTTDDKLKDRLFEKLVDGDSARLTAVRTQFESEIRQIKESFREDEKRMVDRFERDRQDMRNAHERELALVRSSYDSALASAKSAYEVQLSAAKNAFDTQTKILESENRKLDKDNTEHRLEVKELRAKKDKGLPEMAKEIEAAKDLLGLGDNEDKGIGEKIGDLLTNPDAIASLGKLIRPDGPPAAAPVAAQAPAVQERKVVKNKQGQKFIVEPDGSLTGPLREKPKAVAEGQAPAPPPIDPETMKTMVTMLENAYSNGTSPEMVAQSARPHLTDQILTLIRDVGGVDQFLSKVAKLPGSSPLLSTQAGRNWVRKVGKGLVGDDE